MVHLSNIIKTQNSFEWIPITAQRKWQEVPWISPMINVPNFLNKYRGVGQPNFQFHLDSDLLSVLIYKTLCFNPNLIF